MLRFSTFLVESSDDGFDGPADSTAFFHQTKIHGHDVQIHAAGGKKWGYKPGHYNVAFTVNHSTDKSGSGNVEPHHAVAIVKHVIKKVKQLSARPEVKSFQWQAHDDDYDMAARKEKFYASAGKKLGHEVVRKGLVQKVKLKEMALANKITTKSKSFGVTSTEPKWPDTHKSDAKHVGNIGDLEVHKSENSSGQGMYFTWSPKDRLVHHEVSYTRKGEHLEQITANGRGKSSVKYADVLHHLVTKQNEKPITRSSSAGARKAWESLRNHPDVKVQKFSHEHVKFKDTHKDEQLYSNDHASRLGQEPLRLTKR